jgi:hypothetical protein
MKMTKVFLFPFFIILLLFSGCSPVESQHEKSVQDYQHPIPFNPERYLCYKTEQSMTIDGKDQEDSWEKASWTNIFTDIEGGSKPKPTHETKAKMLWDDTHFYIYAKMDEPHIWATLKQRDTVIFYDDDFEIFIDPDGDSHGYYEFEANAYNTLWELILLRPYRTDDLPKVLNEWNVRGIKTAVHIEGSINDPNDEDAYWSIEWAIPWYALAELAPEGRAPKDKEQWRVNFSRVDWRMKIEGNRYEKEINPQTGKPYPENNWVWSPTGRINMHMPEMWAYVQFSDIIVGSGSTQFQYDPDEEIKWALWQLYFQQVDYFETHGSYTDDLGRFTIPDIASSECKFDPKIYITPHLFEIINETCTDSGNWTIRQDGKIQLK